VSRQSRQEIKTTPKPMERATAGPTQEQVAALAYQLWLQRGCPVGSDREDWFQAEAQLTVRQAAA
jgi:hypothetical protein